MSRRTAVSAATLLCVLIPSSLGSLVRRHDRLPPTTPSASAASEAVQVETALSAAIESCAARRMSRSQRRHLAETILAESSRHGYDPLFVQAMLEVESQCDPRARGPKGSLGLIQLRPATARAVAADAGLRWRGDDMLRETSVNVRLALHYLSQLERRFADPYVALAAYNLGPTRAARLPRARVRRSVYVKKVLARYHDLLAAHVSQTS